MRKVALLAVGALAALAMTAGPAAGGSDLAAGAASCRAVQIDGAETFDGLRSLLVAGSAARGTGALLGREPTLHEKVESLPASAKGKGGRGFRATVPVWFHVITDGGVGSLTQRQIDDQIRVLNLAFAGFYGGAKSGFSFQLAGVTRTDNADVVQRPGRRRRRAGHEAHAASRRLRDAERVLEPRGRVPGLRVPAGPARLEAVPSTASSSTGSRCRAHRRPSPAGTTSA